MKDFYLTLLSDSCIGQFPSNTQSEFTVKLSHSIQLESDGWEVALVECSTPTQIHNITEENNFFFLTFLDQSTLNYYGIENITETCADKISCDHYKVSIPPGTYVTPHHLVEEIQSSIDNFEKGFLKQANAHIQVTYDVESKRMSLSAQNDRQVRLSFPKQFAKIIGLDPIMVDKPVGNEKHMFKYSVDLQCFGSLFIYSDIAEFTFVGHTQAPILRVVSFTGLTESPHFYKEFKRLHYVPVSKASLDQIQVSIKTDTGLNVPFVTGKTLVKLHFRHSHK